MTQVAHALRLAWAEFTKERDVEDVGALDPETRELLREEFGLLLLTFLDEVFDGGDESPRRARRFEWEQAIRASKLSSTTKLVAFALATWMNADGSNAWRSGKQLARDASLARSTVQESFRELEDAGWLRGEHRRGRPTKWVAMLPAKPVPVEDTPVVQADTSQPVEGVVLTDTGNAHPDTGVVLGYTPVREDDTTRSLTRPVTESTNHTAAPGGAGGRWHGLRVDTCCICDRFSRVDGDGICEGCWTEAAA